MYKLTKTHQQGLVDESIVLFNILDEQTNDPKMQDKVVLIYMSYYSDGETTQFRQAMSKQDARNVYSNLRKEGYFAEDA